MLGPSRPGIEVRELERAIEHAVAAPALMATVRWERDNARVPGDPPDPMDPTFLAETRAETAHGGDMGKTGVWPTAGSDAPRYALGAVIGLGGMGEVVAARDERIGRDVALKRIRAETPSPALVTRFLRTARPS